MGDEKHGGGVDERKSRAYMGSLWCELMTFVGNSRSTQLVYFMSLEFQVQSDLLVIQIAAAWRIISILNISIVPIPLHKNLFFVRRSPLLIRSFSGWWNHPLSHPSMKERRMGSSSHVNAVSLTGAPPCRLAATAHPT